MILEEVGGEGAIAGGWKRGCYWSRLEVKAIQAKVVQEELARGRGWSEVEESLGFQFHGSSFHLKESVASWCRCAH